MSGRTPYDGNGLDTEMRETLQRRAADAPRLDLTEGALRRARTIRRRRRLATGAAVLAVAAVLVPVGATLVHDSRTSNVADDAATSTRTSGATSPTGDPATASDVPVTVVGLDHLQRGEDPAVPYIFDAQLLTGGQAESVPGAPADAYSPKETATLLDAARFSDGVAGFVADSSKGSLQLETSTSSVLPTGQQTTQPAIDRNGGVAYAVNGVDAAGDPVGTATLLYATSLRDQPHSTDTDQLTVKQVMDVENGTVLFNAVTPAGDQVVGRADLTADSPTVEQPWPNVVSLSAADQADGIMVGRTTQMGPGDHHCNALLSTEDASEVWHSCTWRPTEFSPDGSRVFAVAINGDAVGPDTAILDARTGQVIREFSTPGRFGRATFEADNALDVVTVVAGRSAIVRCTETGDCELATDPQPARPGSLVVPYQITANP